MKERKLTPVQVVREYLSTIDTSVRFSTIDFPELERKASFALIHLAQTGEIQIVGEGRVGKQNKSNRIYSKTSQLPIQIASKPGRKIPARWEVELSPLLEGWAKVYPEFFSIPDFKILKVTTVKELYA